MNESCNIYDVAGLGLMLFFCFTLFRLIIGDLTYWDEIFEKIEVIDDSDNPVRIVYLIKRTYNSGRIKFRTKRIKFKDDKEAATYRDNNPL